MSPLQIQNSALVQALVQELEPVNSATQGDLDRLNLSVAPFLEKNIESLLDCVDEMVLEQQKVTTYHKAVARQAQTVASWLQKRRQENQARRAAGEEPLPEEDPAVMKPVPELSLLENYLISNQMSTYSDQLNIASTQALQKLYVFEALQK
jgi:translation initiation factor 3 subunit H